ncbi:MAG: glycosyltransferase family 4 protein [Gemmatimonadaceae bacterium]
MRIALISTPFLAAPPRLYGGTELIVHELAEGLVRRGHDVELFATGDSCTSAQLRYLYAEAQWPPEMLVDLNHVSWAMQQCNEEIARGLPFDIIHTHSSVALGCARLMPDAPVVYTLHHAQDESLSAFYRHCQDVHYVAISEDQRCREVSLRHVDVIHHGLDPAKYRWAERATADYVCFVGRLSRVKGPHFAIDAAREAGVPIHVAGGVHPPDECWAAAELQRRLAQPHVSYLGPIGIADKASLLCRARALLAPIEWNEPFGLILIEAMLSGCPVVAFPRGSVPEVVEQGRTGLIVESFEEMVDAIRPGGPVDHIDRAQCRRLATERFGAERMVSDHVALYERIRNERRSSTPRRRTGSPVMA